MAETEELLIRVRLDNQATAQLQALQAQAAGMSSGPGMARMQRQSKEMTDNMSQLTREMRGFGFSIGAIGGLVGGFAVKMADAVVEAVKGITNFKGYANAVNDLNVAAGRSGQTAAQFKELTEPFRRGGVDAAEAAKNVEGLTKAHESFKAVARGEQLSSPYIDKMFEGVTNPQQIQRLQQLKEKLLSAANPAEFMNAVKDAGIQMRKNWEALGQPERGALAQVEFYTLMGGKDLDRTTERFRLATKERNDFLNARTPAANAYRDQMYDLEKAIGKIGTSIKAVAVEWLTSSGVAGTFATAMKTLAQYAEQFETAFRRSGNVFEALKAVGPAALAPLFDGMNQFYQDLKEGLLKYYEMWKTMGVDLLNLFGPVVAKWYTDIKAAFDEVWPEAFKELAPAAKAAWAGIKDALTEVIDPLREIFASEEFKTILRAVLDDITKAFRQLAGLGDEIRLWKQYIAEAADELTKWYNAAKKMFDDLKNWINDAFQIPDWIREKMGLKPNAPRGMPVEGPALTPEDVAGAVPQDKLSESDKAKLARLQGRQAAQTGIKPVTPEQVQTATDLATTEAAQRERDAQIAKADEAAQAQAARELAARRMGRRRIGQTPPAATGEAAAQTPAQTPTTAAPAPQIDQQQPKPPDTATTAAPPSPAQAAQSGIVLPPIQVTPSSPTSNEDVKQAQMSEFFKAWPAWVPEDGSAPVPPKPPAVYAPPPPPKSEGAGTPQQQSRINLENKWAQANLPDMAAKLDQLAVQNVDVSGEGRIRVDVNAPAGTNVSASANGFFRSTEITRQTQMLPAEIGPAPMTGVGAGAGALQTGMA